MKVCPKCDKTYTDDGLNFCLSDGELLMEMETQDAPPTLIMDSARVTNEGDWGSGFDPGFTQQNQPDTQNQQIYQPGPGNPAMVVAPDKMLPTASLILGISSLVLFCCYLGLPLGAAAAITGYIGMNNANKDPQKYGGKELAIIGMILGFISLGLTVLLFVFWVLGMALG